LAHLEATLPASAVEPIRRPLRSQWYPSVEPPPATKHVQGRRACPPRKAGSLTVRSQLPHSCQPALAAGNSASPRRCRRTQSWSVQELPGARGMRTAVLSPPAPRSAPVHASWLDYMRTRNDWRADTDNSANKTLDPPGQWRRRFRGRIRGRGIDRCASRRPAPDRGKAVNEPQTPETSQCL